MTEFPQLLGGWELQHALKMGVFVRRAKYGERIFVLVVFPVSLSLMRVA
jgi:hypothetical protein